MEDHTFQFLSSAPVTQETWKELEVELTRTCNNHSCQPFLVVNLSPEFVNLHFPYAGRGLLFFRWQQQHFEFQPARVAEGRSNVVLNMHAQLQILACCTWSVSVHLAMVCWLLIRVLQYFSVFAQFKTATKSHENYVFWYQFSYMAISPPPPLMIYFISYWLTVWVDRYEQCITIKLNSNKMQLPFSLFPSFHHPEFLFMFFYFLTRKDHNLFTLWNTERHHYY